MPPLIQQAQSNVERQRIYRFRYEVYIEEMGKCMPEADHKQRLLCDDFDEQAIHLFVERDGAVAGALRLIWGRNGWPAAYNDWYALDRFREFTPGKISFTGRLMVAAKNRNSPLGVCLACEIYRIGRQIGLLFDFIHTTPSLIHFFERVGYRRYKNDFTDFHLGKRTPMILVMQDIDHLEDCQSPFLKIARRYDNAPDSAHWLERTFFKQNPRPHLAVNNGELPTH